MVCRCDVGLRETRKGHSWYGNTFIRHTYGFLALHSYLVIRRKLINGRVTSAE